jgi:flagellar motor switch protein FliN/FliY
MTSDNDIGVMDTPAAEETDTRGSETTQSQEAAGIDWEPAEPRSTGADATESAEDAAKLGMLLDVDLKVTVELGRARLKLRDVLNLANGSVVELSRATSEPVDILVNGVLLATGEVVVVDDHFAVRIKKLLDRVERLRRVV